MIKPNLFIVGAPKCGTTSLYRCLNRHPEIFTLNWREPHYFANDLLKESDVFHNDKKYYQIRSEEDYLKLTDDVSSEKIVCEKSPYYLYSELAASNIAEFNPDAKIIIMLREPSELLFSYHAQLVSNGEENLKFVEALEKENERKNGKSVPFSVRVPSYLYYREIIRFGKQISRYLRSFCANQIKVLFLSDMVENPSKEYKDILNFINVEEEKLEKGFEKTNGRTFAKSPRLQQILNYPDSYLKDILRKSLPKKIQEYIYCKLKELNLREDNSEMDIDVKKTLKEELIIEVEETNNLLHKYSLIPEDKDLLEFWGYKNIQ